MSERSFNDVIAEHLELQRRNSGLETALPIATYRQEESLAEEPAVADDDSPTQPVSVQHVRAHAIGHDPASWWEEQAGAPTSSTGTSSVRSEVRSSRAC
jgi:hypothetical protein